jgi:hypothetical protein
MVYKLDGERDPLASLTIGRVKRGHIRPPGAIRSVFYIVLIWIIQAAWLRQREEPFV